MPKPSSSSKVGDMIKGNLCILVATIFFGLNLPVVKILIPHWMTSMDVSAIRMLGGCVLMWLASLFVRNDKIQRRHYINIILGGGVGLFMFIFLFNLALRFSNPIDVSIIMTMPPAFVMLMNIVFRNLRPGPLETAGVIVSFVGAFIIISVGHSPSADVGSERLLGDILALASALCYAFYLVILETPTKTYKPVSLLRWVYLMASVPSLFLISGLCHAEIWHTTQWLPWTLIAFVLICPTFLAYFLMAPAIKLISSELVSIYQYLVPVIASIASVILGVAHIVWPQILAMGIIVIGMVLSNIGKFRRNKKHMRREMSHGILSGTQYVRQLAPMVSSLEESAEAMNKAVKNVANASTDEGLDATKLYDQSREIVAAADKTIAAANLIIQLAEPHADDKATPLRLDFGLS